MRVLALKGTPVLLRVGVSAVRELSADLAFYLTCHDRQAGVGSHIQR